MDNEEEFLIEIAVNLQKYFHAAPQVNPVCSLEILESLLVIEDPVLRQKSIEVVVMIARLD